jgi:hypothetical protein
VKGSPAIRSSVVVWAGYARDSIVRAACEARLHGAVSLSGLEYAIQKLSPDSEHDASLILQVARQAARTVVQLARHGVLDYGVVVDAAMIGLDGGEHVSNAARVVIDAMGEALDVLSGPDQLSRDEEAAVVAGELRARISQIARHVKGEDAEAVRQRAAEILGRHQGEPELPTSQ